MKILMVCLGNICRSPMAEGILRKKLFENNLAVEVDSAGTANYHVGECPDQRAIAVAKSYEVDISALRGRQFNVKDFDRFERIYAMDSSNHRAIMKLARSEEDKSKVFYFLHDKSDVPDPWFGEMEGFYPVYNLLEKAADKIVADIQTTLKKV